MAERCIALAIVGDLAYDQTITPTARKKVFAGAVYNVAVAASRVAEAGTVGVVAKVGDDFSEGIEALSRRGIDVQGIAVVPRGKTAVFTIIQHEDNTRELSAEVGVAGDVDTALFPDSYRRARHVHLASSHPDRYVQWLPHLRSVLPEDTTISADGNDLFLATSLAPMRQALDAVDLVFLNEAELTALQATYPDYVLTKPTVLKKGKHGATYMDKQAGIEITIAAPSVTVVDTSGAGDTLAGAFLVRRLQGATIEEALQSGVTTASRTVTDFGVDHIHPLA